MASFGESSSSAQNDKPLVVRVKRKASQSPLEALWLEINDRPQKRAMLDFASLSLSGSSGKELAKSTKVLVQHVDTLSVSQTTVELVNSIVTNSSETSEYNAKCVERRLAYKKDKKQDQLLFKARQKQEDLAKNARFEQIWRSRMGYKDTTHDKNIHEMYQFYDIVRVDADERSSDEVQKREEISLEDQILLSGYLPLLREHIPGAAADIETDIHNYRSQEVSTDEYVYDYYAMKDDMDIGEEETKPFPLVQVEEEDWYYGTDDSSDDESYDSNAENHFLNDYPDEEDEDDDDEDDKTFESDDESEQDESASENSVESENSLRGNSEGADTDNSADGFDHLDYHYDDFDDDIYGDYDVADDDGDIGDDTDDSRD